MRQGKDLGTAFYGDESGPELAHRELEKWPGDGIDRGSLGNIVSIGAIFCRA